MSDTEHGQCLIQLHSKNDWICPFEIKPTMFVCVCVWMDVCKKKSPGKYADMPQRKAQLWPTMSDDHEP